MRSVLLRILILVSLTSLAVPAAMGSAGAIPEPDAASPPATLDAATAEPAGTSSVPATSQEIDPVELPGERTATSRTYLMPDGSYQSELYTAPVHYQAPSGDWHPIDNTLVPTDRDRFAVENDANDYRLLIPEDAGSAPVRVEVDGKWVSFTAHGVDGAPQIEGSTATMSGGLGPNARLKYQATNQGVKETVVLSAPPNAAPSYAFDLHASPGLTPRLTAGGGVEISDVSGQPVFVVPAPFMTDASGTDAGYSDAVSFDLSPSVDRGWQLTMTPDPAWLADTARVFPVSIDPTVNIITHADTWIDQAAPNNSHGGGNYIKAGWGNGNARRALLKFNLDDIPANATVNSAELRLYLDASQNTSSEPAQYTARRILPDIPWTRDATWNTYDGVTGHAWPDPYFFDGPNPGTTLPDGNGSGYKNFDQTQTVAAFIDGSVPNNGFLVRQKPDGATNGVANILSFFSVNSADDTRWPKLRVNYTDQPLFDKIGDRKFFTFEEQSLNDRMSLKVNVATGNLLLEETDLTIAGTGLDAGVQRFYNSLSTATDPAGLTPGWVLGDSPTVRLEFPGTTGRVVFVGPSGYRVAFDRNATGGLARVEPGIDAELRHNDAANEYVLEWHDKSKFVFDEASGRMKRREDKQGNQITYTYDLNGRLDFLTDTQGRKVDFTYDATGLLDRIVDVAGGRTYDYTYAQFPTDTVPATRLSSFAVTTYGLDTDNLNVGATTSFDYDTAGRLTKVTDPKGNITVITYDGTSRKVKAIQRAGLSVEASDPTTTFIYLGSIPADCTSSSVVSATEVDGPRDEAGIVDKTTYCADTHDRVRQVIDAKGHKRTTGYTSNSNVVSFNESGVDSGATYDYSYTGDNLSQVKLPTGGTSTATYGDSANDHFPTAIRDFANDKASPDATWVYDYDSKGNLIEALAPGEGFKFRYCYDGKGQLQRIDAPTVNVALDEDTTAGCGTANQGNDTLLSYNTAGNLTQVDPPGTHGTRTLTYDAVSRIKTVTDGRGVVTTFRYDALDHITQLSYAGPAGITGVATIDYTYDRNGNLTARQDATGNSNFTYDELNRMTFEDPEQPSSNTTYTYDKASNLKTISVPDEPEPVTYTYDNLNRVTNVVDPLGRQTTFGYNTRDLRTSTVYPNGVTMKTDYDSSRRINCTYAFRGTAPPVTNGCPTPSTDLVTFFSYDYTSSTNQDTLTRWFETNRENHTTTYVYDSIQRLTDAITTNSNHTILREYQYRYGARGNIDEEVVNGNSVPNTVTSFAYNEANELCWTASGTSTAGCASPPTGATTYNYDNAGNLTSTNSGLSALYNLQNQTSQATGPDGVLDMQYADATSDRRTRAGDRRMSYNQLGLAAQAPNSGVPHTDWFLRDPNGLLVSRTDRADSNADTRDFFYIFDGLGSVAAVTGPPGSTFTRRYIYEPYGEQISPDPRATNADGITQSDTNPWRYASGYYDFPTGMLKFGTRYYMPSTLTANGQSSTPAMRWTQTDPVAGQPSNPMTLNPYSYVGCDPVNSTDPSGRFWDDFVDAVESVVTSDAFEFLTYLAVCGEGALAAVEYGGAWALSGGPWGVVAVATGGCVAGMFGAYLIETTVIKRY